MILCECGEFVEDDIFKDYIKTSSNPSTSTIGHQKCGMIFDFTDKRTFKQYSSKKELKTIAMKFADKRNIENETVARFLLEVDRLKSSGKFSDCEILATAYKKLPSKY